MLRCIYACGHARLRAQAAALVAMPAYPARPLANLLCSLVQLTGWPGASGRAMLPPELLAAATARIAEVAGQLPLLHTKRAAHALAVALRRAAAPAAAPTPTPGAEADGPAAASVSNAAAMSDDAYVLFDSLARHAAATLAQRPAPGRLGPLGRDNQAGLLEGLARAFAVAGCNAGRQPGVALLFDQLAARVVGGEQRGRLQPEQAASVAASFAAVGLDVPGGLVPPATLRLTLG